MDIRQLPDLSDWLFVEVWTLEEAAMLWAAIDPIDHGGKRLADLKDYINSVQYRKALIYLRAAKEAVCAGTLSFTEAWEEHEDNQGNFWLNEIEYPRLPQPLNISSDKTRVQQAAFIRWTQSKRIPSFRQSLKRLNTIEVIQSQHVTPKNGDSISAPLLPRPSPLDKSHPCHPVELRAGFEAWETVVSSKAYEAGKSPKAAVRAVLDDHPEYSHLSAEAKTRISTVANWNKEGGATKTPSRASLPTPKK